MKPQHTQIEHTAEFSRRRRALFPSETPSDCDSDLGCISPLNFDSDEHCPGPFSLSESVGDYDIIGLVVKTNSIQTPTSNPALAKVLTPCTIDESPTQKLKTPHDTSDNSKFPKLVRKIPVDAVPSSDVKNPKVRTALFPDNDMSLPSRIFYPKSETEVSPRPCIVNNNTSSRKTKRKQALYLCNRKSRYRSGQINAGVRHKIKKRKIVKLNKSSALQAAINIIENSPLNSVLNEPLESQTETLLNPQTLHSSPPRDPTPSPEPDPTKKFFKSSRHRGIVTVSSNIKIEMNKGHVTLLPNKKTLKRPRPSEQSNAKRQKLEEFENESFLIPEHDISNIISSLEDSIENKENNKNLADPVVLMSPTSQMCNMTSGLALNSPKKARDLTNVLESMSTNEPQPKLFPVFYPGKTIVPTKPEQLRNTNGAKKFKALSKDQMLLDAGQKRWGVTQCPECKIVYNMGDPSDEIMHLNYHNAIHIFRFTGWKNERVVSNTFSDGRIIQIVPGDPKSWWKKVKQVMEVINRDLGFYDIEFNTAQSQIFFYIKNKSIVGALVAEVKTVGHRLLTKPEDQVDLCSEESYPTKCGVSRLWVAQNYRKKGLATALMDSLKRNFVFGHILKNEDIAFSSPTEMGKRFGQNYFKTPHFLIYFV